jgi:hypothetical protein
VTVRVLVVDDEPDVEAAVLTAVPSRGARGTVHARLRVLGLGCVGIIATID